MANDNNGQRNLPAYARTLWSELQHRASIAADATGLWHTIRAPAIRKWLVLNWRKCREVCRCRSNSLTNSVLSSGLNLVLLIGVGLTIASTSYDEPPAKRYPASKTAEVQADRELILVTSEGSRFARRGGCVDTPVRVSELPPHFVGALLSMEDRRFYQHPGIDLIGIARASLANYQAGRIIQGASTLTQQLAKMTYLTRVRSFDRKLEEAIVALKIEFELTKDEILERYLSKAYFGKGCFGLRSAARHYYGKAVSDLSVAESAYLVALLPSPTRYSADPKTALERTRLVLKAMVETGHLDPEDVKQAIVRLPAETDEREFASYYADWVAQTIELPRDGSSAPLIVKTHLDRRLQKLGETAVGSIMDKYGKSRRAGQAALVAMRPDGRVLAMVGGRNYADSGFNRAVQAMRQPGSAFKTFVYFAALRGGADPGMTVNDEPYSLSDWSPKNYGNGYRGAVSLTQAFASSINTVAVRVSETVGLRHVITAASDLGITTKIDPNPSLALGTSEVNLLELTSAYAAIAADAYPVRPRAIAAIGSGADTIPQPYRDSGLWRLEHGDELRTLLANVVRFGTGQGARLPIPAYGKTGTSQDFRDAWFIGFAGNLVVGVWVGNDDNAGMRGVTGGSLPAMIWRQFMNSARTQDPEFSPRLIKVEHFPAKRRNIHHTVAWSSLEARVIDTASWTGLGGSYGPRPSLIGREGVERMFQDQQQRQEQNRRRAPRGRFDPFGSNDSG